MILSKKSFYVIVILTIVVDQITKYVALCNLDHSINIFRFMNLILVKNFGVSFGILNFGIPLLVTRIFLSILVIAIVTFLLKTQQKTIAISLIIGGACGNLIDRIFLGYVIDFIDLFIGVYHWPAFNIADSAICVGVTMYTLSGKTSLKKGDTNVKM